MDNSKFDDIIKSKLESHVDPSGPSGTEVSKMFDGLANVGVTATSIVTKMMVAASSILLITTIFFIYRTYILEETILSLSDQISSQQIETSINNRGRINQIVYSTDTVFWDSLEVITRRVLSQNTSNQPSFDINALLAENKKLKRESAPFSLSAQDSQRFVNEVMGQLVATLETNPKLLQELFAGVDLSQFEQSFSEDMNADISTPVNAMGVSREKKVAGELGSNNVQALLKEIASEESGNKALQNIVNGYAPETTTDDQMRILNTSDENDSLNVETLSEKQQTKILSEFLKHDPDKVLQAAETIQLNSAEIEKLNKYVSEKTDIRNTDKVVDTQVYLAKDIAAVREDQYKENNKSWWLYGGPGLGSTPINQLGNSLITSFKIASEFKPNERFGFSMGATYHYINGEKHNPDESAYYNFYDISDAVQADVKEIKINLHWMDVPLEAKFYILPNKKINPFVALSIRARATLSESYTFETNGDDYLNPEYEEGTKFIFPSYGAASGIRFKMGTKFDGAIQAQKSFGGKAMGPLKTNYNTFQGQVLLFYRLD